MLNEIDTLYRGLIIGLIIAAPVGPVGLLCIRRTFQKGIVIGFATGLGAALADAFFGAIAVLGVRAVVAFIEHYSATIRLVGGVVVLATAWHTWRDKPEPPKPKGLMARFVKKPVQENSSGDAVRAWFSGFGITITNPLTLFGTFAVIVAFGANDDRSQAGVMIGGIFMGSILWWFLLSGGISLLRDHCTESRILMVNRVTSVVLAALGLWAVISGIHGYMT